MGDIQHVLQHAKSFLSSGPATKIKQLREGRAEAVTLVLVPLELKEVSTGIRSTWNAIVTKDAEGNRRVVSVEQVKNSPPEITVEPSMLRNTTISDILEQLFHGATPTSNVAFE